MNMHTDRYYDSYDAMAFLFDRYSASDRYKGNDEESLKEWQTKERTVLKKLIGLDKLLDGSMGTALSRGSNEDDIHPGLAVISSEKLPEGIIRKKCLFRVDEYTYMPMFVLYPAEKPKGTFLALAGHQGGGKDHRDHARGIDLQRDMGGLATISSSSLHLLGILYRNSSFTIL